MNSYHFKNYLDFIFEWIPQQLFFFCTFGYMCILIIFKWTIEWGVEKPTDLAPSIIGQMIALPLKVGSTEGKPLWDVESQESLQYTLLLISLICVPVMLIPKPFFIWLQTPKKSEPHHVAPQIKHHESMSEEEGLDEKLIDDDETPGEPHHEEHAKHADHD